MLKKTSLVFIIIFFFFEFFFNINYYLIDLRTIYYFPDTIVKEKLIKKIKTKNKEKISLEYFDDEVLKIKDGNFLILHDTEDFELGAKNFIKYKNGFCNKEFSPENFKIISVGDSFVNCNLLDYYSAWPIKIFGKNYNKSINLGKNGSSPIQYNKILKKYINNNTKVVIYGFYEGNNLYKILPIHISETKNIITKKNIKYFIKKIFGYSINLNLIYAKYYKYIIKYKYKKLTIPSNDNDIRFISKLSNIKFNTHNLDIDELSFAKKFLTLSDLKKNIYSKKLLEIFSEAKNISTNNDSMIIFIYIPNSFTAFQNASTFYNNNNKLILSEYSKISQRIFSQVCIKLKLRCINTVETFQKYNIISKYPSHFPKSNSLTEAGHELIARKVFDELCKNETNKLIFDQECNSNF
jgi:hypothetical protein